MNSAIRISFTISLLVLLSTIATAAPRVRVVDVKDSHTIVVDNRGIAATVRLAQSVVPPDEEQAAAAYLRNALVSSWVLVETDARGESYVYRSPDGLFVNGELARRAYASGRTTMVWLGESNPGPQRTVTRSEPKAKAVSMTPPRPQRARTTPRGAHRIPRTK